MDVLRQLKFKLIMALAQLGLVKPHDQEEEEGGEEEEEANELTIPSPILIMDGSSPSLVPARKLMAMVKTRVPVVQYASFLERHGHRVHEGEIKNGWCAVCLSSIEQRDEVRELSNCSHAFHRECLDRWVDHNQVTCPLCRSLLFPPKRERTRISCFLGEEDDGA